MLAKRSAFSLIELSIVILVIGILIAGITSGSSLIGRYKLDTARRLTNNSPIAQTKDLVAWYETSLEVSFDSAESVDGTLLTNWYDGNTQSSVKLNATQTTSTNKPFYYADSSLGFPLVGFATNDFFNLPNGTISPGSDSYTFFIVSKIAADCTCGMLSAGTASTGYLNAVAYLAGNNLNNYWWGDDISTTATPMSPVNKLRVISVVYDSNLTRKIYINGVEAAITGNPSSHAKTTALTNNVIGYGGGTSPYYLTNGKIGEVAIFSRGLKNDERSDIEKYLGKKFGIAVTSS